MKSPFKTVSIFKNLNSRFAISLENNHASFKNEGVQIKKAQTIRKTNELPLVHHKL